MAAQASLLGKATSEHWDTSLYFQGKAKGLNEGINASAAVMYAARNKAQDEAARLRAEGGDSLAYQFVAGVAAGAVEALALYELSEQV